ncbi:short chain dehydrogenase reductase [Grosmannia clavigera kw1407]|uniref:Short chain dehydrogenase reductase n=1 Tax=Grosmannia clavigera (strain kw1407 / UAMH 11150) TaxID=655863 RepID=F0XM97_GROCL|nr:short chain dehydrogenase reductase [Grosmannia clavigera kw1407]EFX01501.1 short chain dehydrogenase reductase [Grosmannia clavigera kw1407]
MTRVPTEEDFASLAPDLTVALHFPDPPASTTAILLLFHGLGDSEAPFASFARALNLPGVLAVAVRGPNAVPFGDDVDDDFGTGPRHFHWGDDLQLRGADIDPDPGFDRALRLVGGRLVRDVLGARCGWRPDDLLLFGFGQGGTFALALAAAVPTETPCKGVITVGADVPSAIAVAASEAPKTNTPLLVCGAVDGEAVSDETVLLLRNRFAVVQTARWVRPSGDDAMPRSRAEMLPIMQFLLPKLRACYPFHFLWGQWHTIPLPPSGFFAGQTVLVTGANGGLGLEAARHMALLGAARVVLACRSVEKAEAAAADIRASLPLDRQQDCVIDVWDVDLASFASVAALARRAAVELGRLDVVVENAGVARPTFSLADGHETTITVNVLSTGLLGLLLLPLLRRTAIQYNVRPRLVVVSSDAHLFARFNETKAPSIFEALRDPAHMSHDRYNASKLMEVYFVRQLARVLDAHHIPVTANCLNPGFCRTELFRSVPVPFRYVVQAGLHLLGRTAEMGARTLVAAAAAGNESHGQYMDSGIVWPPSPAVTSAAGVAIQERLFGELLDVLESVHPGVKANLE